ncbi:MAG: TPM domain-containing protein [Acidimicrobiia bacterium]|nr:TPM domain-containing protein [Acidimicrobiia bacterium]NNF10337.1 TPM domain-containing protein [Acidimicrobiia bacterium]NNL69115.1 TPM domain-containing protein [Acidimicrobiia bacterium]
MRPGILTRLLSIIALMVGVLVGPAGAQATCPEFEGFTCDGYVTDRAGVIDNDETLESEAARIEGMYGAQVAVVLVDSVGDWSIERFAQELGNTWGVGSAERNDGVVVVVDVGGRNTWVEYGDGLADFPRDPSDIAALGNAGFRNGDFGAGVLGILSGLGDGFEAYAEGETSEPYNWTPALVVGGLGVLGLAGAGGFYVRNQSHRRTRRRWAELVDGELARLEIAGHELPLIPEYAAPRPDTAPEASTIAVVDALNSMARGEVPRDQDAVAAAWSLGLIDMIDRERLLGDTEIPLELQASGERDITDEAVQAVATQALATKPGREEEFDVQLKELTRLIDSLRPHRVAGARYRLGQQINEQLADTIHGAALVTDFGERYLRASPALDAAMPAAESALELDTAYDAATTKTRALEELYDKLPDSAARPAVAAALADLGDDLDNSVERYARVQDALERRGRNLKQDGLDLDAIAALLVLNNDEAAVDDFIDAYDKNRANSLPADQSVEYALAGLTSLRKIKAIRARAKRLGLPVGLTAALLRARPDGVEVYEELATSLVEHGITGDSRRTIAAILAISLEPAQAERRWLEARHALSDLGLEGSYADVAAAFGASDPRGPRQFAIAYAAQRQALARSRIKDADRFAPELAHQGTSRQQDSWTGRTIPPRLGYFDPYTLFFYHWIITRGSAGTYGWEPVYQDQSWSGDRDSWFGGFGGGTFGSGGGGGSSWGGGSWGGGGFGGFGGGGFGGGGGGGGSGW